MIYTPPAWNHNPDERRDCMQQLFSRLLQSMALPQEAWEQSGYRMLLAESFEHLLYLSIRELERIYSRAVESTLRRHDTDEAAFRHNAADLIRSNLHCMDSYARLYVNGEAEWLRIRINEEFLREMSRRACVPIPLEQLSLDAFVPQLTALLRTKATPILLRRVAELPYLPAPECSRWYHRLPPLRRRLDGNRFRDHHIAVTGQLWQEQETMTQLLHDELDSNTLLPDYAAVVDEALTREVTRLLDSVHSTARQRAPFFPPAEEGGSDD